MALAILHIFGKPIEKGYEWKDFLVLMQQKRAFYDAVSKGPHECPPKALEKLAPIVNAEDFTEERMMSVSAAATELVGYVKAWFEWQLVKTRIEKMQHVYDVDTRNTSPRRIRQHFKLETYSSRKKV